MISLGVSFGLFEGFGHLDLSNMVNVILRYIYYECLASNKLERLIAGAAAYGAQLVVFQRHLFVVFPVFPILMIKMKGIRLRSTWFKFHSIINLGTPKYQDAFTSFIDMVNGKLGNPEIFISCHCVDGRNLAV
ncbi:hypothetical protein C5167_041334 [Papaver somniferum]|uniref:Uncharacterized protein n=1 Tax=Papaver somniferum TaxID=3469 RepID=A0A4Y7IKY4_PAPSO|nr:hypothetical protein C5167_041334 [Papaver somniferum]